MPGKKVSPDLRKELAAIATPVHKAKGTILFRAGRPGHGAFLIRSGKVRLTLGGGSGLCPARVLGLGAVIGLPATFSGEPYSLTAEVAEDCRLEFIPRRRLLNLLRRNPQAGFQIVRMLSEEIFQMRKSAKLLSSQPRTQSVH